MHHEVRVIPAFVINPDNTGGFFSISLICSVGDMLLCYKYRPTLTASQGILPGGVSDTPSTWSIPYHEVEALARVLLPEILAFFESEEGQREYAEWKVQQEAQKAD